MTGSGHNDDAWDNICLNPHHIAHYEGRESGRSDGAIAGYEEGFRLGQTMALSYGIEVGLYMECCRCSKEIFNSW
jgi:hypothetical protein